jgi:hypothetical protein
LLHFDTVVFSFGGGLDHADEFAKLKSGMKLTA